MKPRPLPALLAWAAVAWIEQVSWSPLGPARPCAALAAAAGVLLWSWLARQEVRLRWSTALLAAVFLLGQGILLAWNSLAGPAAWLGPERNLMWQNAAGAALHWGCLVAWLRCLSTCWAPLATLELGVAAAYLAEATAAHRDGFINRPFRLVDPIWARGEDPAGTFVFLGLTGLFFLFMLASARPAPVENRRTRWDLPLLLLLLLVAARVAPVPKVRQTLESFGMGRDSGPDNRFSNQGGASSTATPGPQTSDQRQPAFSDAPPPPKHPRSVAVVLFEDDWKPASGYYYLRQSSQSQFNGSKLVSSPLDADTVRDFPTAPLPEAAPPPAGVRSLTTEVTLLTQHSHPFGLDTPTQLGSSDNPDPSRFQKAYAVRSQVLVAKEADYAAASASTTAALLEGPADPRYALLAQRITSRLPLSQRAHPWLRALAIRSWLNKHATYSLQSPSKNAPDPVLHYLFGTAPGLDGGQLVGYCVYTSHAACYLYRAAGIPARIANGYAVPAARLGSGSSLLIQDKDSHSWPEIQLDGLGWIELDVAPEKNLEPPSRAADASLQQMLGELARYPHKKGRPEEQPSTRKFPSLSNAFPWLLLLLYLALRGFRLWRRWGPYIWHGGGLPRRALLSALDALAEQGCTRGVHESREGFARRLAEQVPELARLTDMHQRAWLRGESPPPQQVLDSLSDSLKQIDGRPLHWWKRCLGYLDPTCSFRVK